MYNLEDFEPYTLRKHLPAIPVLAWSLKSGYHFLSFTDQMKAYASGELLKIVGVLK